MKLKILKNTTPDEQLEVTVDIDVNKAWGPDLAAQAFKLVDKRHWEMSERIIEANTRHKKVFKDHGAEAYQSVVEIFEVLTGQRRPDMQALNEQQTKAEAVDGPRTETPVEPA